MREKDLPTSKEQIKACGKKFKGICGAIAKWHEVDLETGEVGENPVDVGKEGWDTQGQPEAQGRLLGLREGEPVVQAQGHRARGQDAARYICAVHAEMQGEITVEG